MRKIKLFIGFCLICGLLIVASSIAGSKMIRPNGIFTGAIVGGLIGIMIASKIAVYISMVIIPDQCEPLIPIQSEPLFRAKVNHLLK